jgi:cell division protein FtsB
MIEQIKNKIDSLPNFVKNKFFIASLIFFVWVMFFDQNKLIDRFKSMHELNQLEKDKDYYINRIKEENEKLDELEDGKNLEKFAREEYLMKKEDEEIFVIFEED